MENDIELLRKQTLELQSKIQTNNRPEPPYRPTKVLQPDKSFIITRIIYSSLLILAIYVAKFLFPLYFLYEYIVILFNTTESKLIVAFSIITVIIQLYYSYKDYTKYKTQHKKYNIFKAEMNKYEIEKEKYDAKLKLFQKIDAENDRIRDKISNIQNKIYALQKPSNKTSYDIKPIIFEKKEIQKNILSKYLYCPKCGYKFLFDFQNSGKISGGIGGMASGALLGSKVGLALGPLGAIAGTIPGAIIGGFLGKNIGNNFDKPTCPKCKTSFDLS